MTAPSIRLATAADTAAVNDIYNHTQGRRPLAPGTPWPFGTQGVEHGGLAALARTQDDHAGGSRRGGTLAERLAAAVVRVDAVLAPAPVGGRAETSGG